MKSATKDKVYKSPVRKLARFFEKSRDQWKAKCRKAKMRIKQLKSRVRFLEKSRERWKNRAQELEEQVKQKNVKERELKERLKALEEKVNKKTDVLDGLKDFTLIPRYHQYSVGHVKQYTDLVLSDAISLRGASRATDTMVSSLQLPLAVPTWYTGRLWLLRLGYYKLTRPKEQADDWIWIADHTVQIGAEKCLVILGIRMSALPPAGQCVSHQDVEPIAILPVKKSNKDVVYQQLEALIEKMGVPRLIVGDHGSDLKAGIERFCREHPESIFPIVWGKRNLWKS